MSSKLEHFTQSARYTFTLSQEEALRLNSDSIGTEHLLLALVHQENRIPVQVLRQQGVEPGQVIRAVERAVDQEKNPPSGPPPLTPGMKRAIEVAVEETRSMGGAYVGTGHLLLGLVDAEDGVAVQVLRALGVDLDCLRTQTVEHIAEFGEIEE